MGEEGVRRERFESFMFTLGEHKFPSHPLRSVRFSREVLYFFLSVFPPPFSVHGCGSYARRYLCQTDDKIA